MGDGSGVFEVNALSSQSGVQCPTQMKATAETGDGLNFKASRSSAVFGKSKTNQMASLRVLAIIKW